MIKIDIKSKGSTVKSLVSSLDSLQRDFRANLKTSAEESQKAMQGTIEINRKRASSPTTKPHLIDLIKVENIKDTPYMIAYGIGNINAIESEHKDPIFIGDTGKGWRLLNWGGLPGNGKNPAGIFSDGFARPGASSGRFQYNKNSHSRLYPKNPVVGINFIGAGEQAMSNGINKNLGKLFAD
jgi:hypothetical protein